MRSFARLGCALCVAGALVSWPLGARAQVVLAQPGAPAQAQQMPAEAPPDSQQGWPREYQSGQLTFSVYQPQVESWDQATLSARAAVSVQREGAAAPEYGTIEFTARTLVDKEAGIVTMSDVTIASGSFPATPDQGKAYVIALKEQMSIGTTQIDLGRLEASLAIETATKQANQSQPVDNTPPQIIYSPRPAVLVRVDGAPVLRNFGNGGYMRVINTRALILLDQKSGKYYLRVLGAWAQAGAVEGPWEYQPSPPPALEQALADAKADEGIDLMDPSVESKYGAAQVVVYVTTGPSELIQTDDQPDFAPIPGTQILYAQDTESQLFLYLPEQRFYFLVSGRWFRSPSLDKGPWEYVDQTKLPADFAKIPEGHPSGGALASIAGTPESQEAVISNSIPQTAEVQLASPPTLSVAYDGQPLFETVEGTPLQCASNSLTPVVCVNPNSYYAVENGVWFQGGSPNGPWLVATQVPAVIYTIPVRSRFHYITYVRVYHATPSVVVVGYTPGYYGTVVAPSGCVVYGTGYVYRPYCGAFWVPPPLTYGWGATFSVGYRTGFSFGFTGGWYVGAWCRPYWGGFGWNHVHSDFRVVSFNHYNSFRHWDRGVVVRHSEFTRAPGRDFRGEPGRDFRREPVGVPRREPGAGREVGHEPGRGEPLRETVRPRLPNNVVAGRDGQVYRRTETGALEKHDQGQWKPLGKEQADRAAEVNREMAARGHGEERARAAQDARRVSPGGEIHKPASVPVAPGPRAAPPPPRPAAAPPPPHAAPAPPPRAPEGRGGGGGKDNDHK